MSQVIISLKPEYAQLVVAGDKTVELRNRIVKLKRGTLIWIYATRPLAGIVGSAEIAAVVHAEPSEIWRRFGASLGIDRIGFDAYIGERQRVSALVLRSVTVLGECVTLDRIRQTVGAFHPPQFYSRLRRGSPLRRALDVVREDGRLLGER